MVYLQPQKTFYYEKIAKIAVIGDIHGTNKFLDCYDDILKNHNDVAYIFVLGDHFDPYEEIPFEDMIRRYNEFTIRSKTDPRIISLLGNHDLATYVIPDEVTNRTEYNAQRIKILANLIAPNLKDSYIVYRLGNYLISHAGVSNTWIRFCGRKGYDFKKLQKKGWTPEALAEICAYSTQDRSGWGNHTSQGPTWIRPMALAKDPYNDYNQIVGHSMTQTEAIEQIQMTEKSSIWLTDNCGKSECLILEVEV